MEQIVFEFHEAKRQEILLEKLQCCMRSLTKEYAGVTADIRLSWEGEAADIFINKMESLKEKMQHTTSLLGKAGEELHKTSRRVKTEEEKIKEIAEKREYI